MRESGRNWQCWELFHVKQVYFKSRAMSSSHPSPSPRSMESSWQNRNIWASKRRSMNPKIPTMWCRQTQGVRRRGWLWVLPLANLHEGLGRRGWLDSDLSLLVFLPRTKRFSKRLERGLIIWIKGRIYVDLKLDGRSLSVCPLFSCDCVVDLFFSVFVHGGYDCLQRR